MVMLLKLYNRLHTYTYPHILTRCDWSHHEVLLREFSVPRCAEYWKPLLSGSTKNYGQNNGNLNVWHDMTLMYVCVYGNVHSVGNSSLKYRNAVTINMLCKCVERSLWECLGVATWRRNQTCGTQIVYTYIHTYTCMYIHILANSMLTSSQPIK